MYQELETAKRFAVRAGAILLEHYSRPSAGYQRRENQITEARRSVSAFLDKELGRSFPDDGILSQEDCDRGSSASKSRIWIIEPLDGTLEFTRRQNEFAVMIGLSIDGTASLGVVYQPRTEKMYYAASGSGAFLMENRATRLLQVSREADPLAMTIAHSRLHHSPGIDLLQRELGIDNAISYGSIGLNIGLICEGLAHLYVQVKPKADPWNTCATEVILHEAGGRMTNLFNAPLRYDAIEVRNPSAVIASNGVIHDRIVDAVQSSLPGTK